MKKVFCLIIALSLVFGAISPVFAATEVFNQSWSDDFNSIDSNLSALLRVFTGSVGTMYNSVSELMSWLTPVGSFNSNSSITGVTLYEIVDYIAWTLSGVGPTVYQTFQDIATSVTSSETILSNTSFYISSLVTSLTNSYKDASSLTVGQVKDISHRALVNENNASYTWKFLGSDGSITTNNYSWTAGTPFGNIALMLQKFNENFSTFGSYYIATLVPHLLDHYADTLTTWEHSTNTQTTFTPGSLAQALYRYLAYIQSDTSALWYYGLLNSNTSQSLLAGVNTVTFNPTSAIDGLYQYLNRCNQYLFNNTTSGFNIGIARSLNYETLSSNNTNVKSINQILNYYGERIQKPVARLAFVLANDEEIAARNASKDDQNSVINNFVASTGQATATPSDYAGVSNASASFKQNFNTGVASSGIWDTFSNTHYTWFTQETANALDTVSASTRGTYDTPLLDNYYHEILGYFDNNRRNEDNAYDYVGNYIEQFNAERVESESDER